MHIIHEIYLKTIKNHPCLHWVIELPLLGWNIFLLLLSFIILYKTRFLSFSFSFLFFCFVSQNFYTVFFPVSVAKIVWCTLYARHNFFHFSKSKKGCLLYMTNYDIRKTLIGNIVNIFVKFKNSIFIQFWIKWSQHVPTLEFLQSMSKNKMMQ